MLGLEEVLSWLNVGDRTHLTDASAALQAQLNNALDGQQFDQAENYLRRLRQAVHQSRDDKELVEIGIISARALNILGEFDQTETVLKSVILRSWADKHRRAVAEWMLGNVLWQSPARREETLLAWRDCLCVLNELSESRARSPQERRWYAEKSRLVNQSILEAIQHLDDLPVPAAIGVSKKTLPPPLQVGIGSAGTGEAPIPVSGDLLRLFTVSEEIPAGGFGPTGSDPNPLARIEADQLLIDGRPYRVHNPRGGRIVNLPPDSKFFVLKVKGDSMDRENILDQDFVLVRQVDKPSSGDFVAAEILGVDSHATLKRFVVEKDQVILQPRSNNPVHQPFVFKKTDKGFSIRGVVLAVLKPA